MTGEVALPEGTEMVMPGDNIALSVKLIAPIAMNAGLRFAIREGGRTVGSGVVTNVVDRAEPDRRDEKESVGGPVLGSAGRHVSFLFATCRERDAASTDHFTHERASSTSYGVAQVRVPEERHFGTLGRPWKLPILSIQMERERARKHFIINTLEVLTLDRWKAMVRDHESDDALVFVHGFNTSFVDGIYRAAQIFWDLQYEGVPLYFSWASGAQVADYLYDYDSADHGVDPFCETLGQLIDSGINRINIIAHSMGNQLVVNALE